MSRSEVIFPNSRIKKIKGELDPDSTCPVNGLGSEGIRCQNTWLPNLEPMSVNAVLSSAAKVFIPAGSKCNQGNKLRVFNQILTVLLLQQWPQNTDELVESRTHGVPLIKCNFMSKKPFAGESTPCHRLDDRGSSPNGQRLPVCCSVLAGRKLRAIPLGI
jgi:hypothetical protein